MIYMVMYRSESGTVLTRWRITYPSRCVAEMKVAEFAARGVEAIIVEAEKVRERRYELGG